MYVNIFLENSVKHQLVSYAVMPDTWRCYTLYHLLYVHTININVEHDCTLNHHTYMNTFHSFFYIITSSKWRHFPRSWPFVRGIPRTKASDAELWCFLKQSRGWWFETPSGSLLRHCNESFCWPLGFTLDLLRNLKYAIVLYTPQITQFNVAYSTSAKR